MKMNVSRDECKKKEEEKRGNIRKSFMLCLRKYVFRSEWFRFIFRRVLIDAEPPQQRRRHPMITFIVFFLDWISWAIVAICGTCDTHKNSIYRRRCIASLNKQNFNALFMCFQYFVQRRCHRSIFFAITCTWCVYDPILTIKFINTSFDAEILCAFDSWGRHKCEASTTSPTSFVSFVLDARIHAISIQSTTNY